MRIRHGYKATEVGVIPDNWDVRPLLATVRIANGQVDPRVEPYRSMTLVAPDHIESGTGRLLSRQTASDQRAISGKYLFGRGDIVYSKIRPYLRKAVKAEFDGLCSADMYPLRPAADVSAGFMLGLLLGHRFTKYAESVSVRSGMPKINRVEMADFVVPLPPLPEQRAIAQAMSDADALLDSLDRLIVKKRDLKEAAMQQLLTGQTRLPDFHGRWAVQRLGGQIELRTGFPFSSDQYVPGGVRLLRGSNVKRGKTDWSDDLIEYWPKITPDLSQYELCEGDLVIAMDGSLVGRSYARLQKTDVPALLLQRVARIRSQSLDVEFLAQVIGSDVFVKYCDSVKTVTAIPHISPRNILDFTLPLPPTKEEQGAIAAALSAIDAELTALEKRVAKTRDLKQGMMQELLTGRTRLIPSEDENA